MILKYKHMKINHWVRMKWMVIKRFFIWMQLHHIKNFIIFWVRLLIILIALALAVGVWFMDSQGTIGLMVSFISLFAALLFTVNNYKVIKRLHKKYTAYLKSLPRDIRSMF